MAISSNGVDFRLAGSGPYIGIDPTGHVLSRNSSSSYNGTDGHGFLSTAFGSFSDQNATVPVIAGVGFGTSVNNTYRIDITNGTYDLRMCVGSTSATAIDMCVWDGYPSDGASTWARMVWAQSASVAGNAYTIVGGRLYKSNSASSRTIGASATAPTHTTGTVADNGGGTVSWTYIKSALIFLKYASSNVVRDATGASYSGATPAQLSAWNTGNLPATGKSITAGFVTITGGETVTIALRYFGWTSAGPTYSLSLDAGGFTLAGQTAGLAASRKLSLAGASYALTGQTVAMNRGRLLSAAGGVFSLVGGAMVGKAARKLTFAAGAFAMVGQAITMSTAPPPFVSANMYFLTDGDSRGTAGISSVQNQTNGYSTYQQVLGAAGWLPGETGHRMVPGRYSSFAIGASKTPQGASNPRKDASGNATTGRWDRPDGAFASNKGYTYAAAHEAGIIILLYGTNDDDADIPTTTLTNIETMMDGYGPSKLIILLNELPRGINMAGSTESTRTNGADRYTLSRELLKYDYASGDAKARGNVIAVNTWDAFIDVASGSNYYNLRGLLYDGLHPAPYGGQLLAKMIAARMEEVYGAAWDALPSLITLPTANGFSNLADTQPFIHTNPLMTPGTAGTVSGTWASAPSTSGVPQAWTLTAGSGASVLTGVSTKGVDTDPDGNPATKIELSGTLANTGTAVVSLSQTLSGTALTNAISAGRLSLSDKLRGMARIKIAPGSALMYHARVRLVIQDSSSTRSQQATAGQGSNIANCSINGYLDAGDGEWRDFLTEILDMQDPNLVAQSQNITSLSSVSIFVDIAFSNQTGSSASAGATVWVALAGAYRLPSTLTTFTADGGTFTLTGQTAALKAARKLGAASGIFTLTGQPAGLAAARRLSLATGSFALTGQAVTFTRGRRFALDPGAVVLTGQAATLRANRRVSFVGGSFSFQGQAASMVRGRRWAADGAALALSGLDITFRRDRRLAAGVGVFAVSGLAAAITASRRLSAAPGAFVITGQTIGIVQTRLRKATVSRPTYSTAAARPPAISTGRR